jgi:hypothetical protein
MSTPTIFTLQSCEDEFYTGSAKDGTQVLMGLLCPYIVTYYFNADGVLMNGKRQLWKHPAPRMGENGPYKIYDPQFVANITQQIQEWQQEIGFQPMPIRIQKFGDTEMSVGIDEVPGELEDAIADDPQNEDLIQELEEWKEQHACVLYWGKDYWVSPTGEVLST